VRCAASVLGSAFLLHCSSIDERTPGTDEGGIDAAPGEQQAMPTLQPAPGTAGAAGGAAVNGSESNAVVGAPPASAGQAPGSRLEPLARGAECTAEQACQGGLVCGRSATPDIGTGRVCCDQACEGSCQGCSVGLNAGTCAAVGNDVSCVAASSREGACSEPGVCTEYCVVGQSLLGQCLVEPG
jgi:hypothetical protein